MRKEISIKSNTTMSTNNPLSISFYFAPILHNLRYEYNCCKDKCNILPTYYLKSNKNNIIGKFCNSCKEEQEKYASDDNNINYHHNKRKNISKITRYSLPKEEYAITNCHLTK